MELASAQLASRLNNECNCIPLVSAPIVKKLEALHPDLSTFRAKSEHMFAASSVFVSDDDLHAISHTIQTIEKVISLPAYAELVSTRNGLSDVAQSKVNTNGLLMGYDFHMTPEGPRLIEINTNAGGAFIVSEMLSASPSGIPCGGANPELFAHTLKSDAFAQVFFEMVASEWRLSGIQRKLKSVAIVDSEPNDQYLYSDMVIAREVLRQHGLFARIVDPSALVFDGERLILDGVEIDVLYNRLTDFYLDEPAHADIRSTILAGQTLVTPSPRHHALFADKRNLEILSNQTLLQQLHVPTSVGEVLQSIPHTLRLNDENAQVLWQRRRKLYFKPATGFGSKATYRGGKLTQRVWNEIREQNYVAQAMIPPPTRLIDSDDSPKPLKFDLRAYTYDGQIALFAARIYQGQTTNFRTKGGGFAPVISTRLAA
ncbi:MAG: hypothetical protein AAF512_07270 [Pseudomonadota bacterium]